MDFGAFGNCVLFLGGVSVLVFFTLKIAKSKRTHMQIEESLLKITS
jgi:hypothetical protein